MILFNYASSIFQTISCIHEGFLLINSKYLAIRVPGKCKLNKYCLAFVWLRYRGGLPGSAADRGEVFVFPASKTNIRFYLVTIFRFVLYWRGNLELKCRYRYSKPAMFVLEKKIYGYRVFLQLDCWTNFVKISENLYLIELGNYRISIQIKTKGSFMFLVISMCFFHGWLPELVCSSLLSAPLSVSFLVLVQL